MPDAVTCPDSAVLQRFVLGQLPRDELETLAEHVESCGRCVGVLQALPAHDPLLGGIQELPPGAPEPTDELVAQLCGLSSLTPDARSGGGLLARLTDVDADNTQELYDFLTPAQAEGELGWLGAYRVLRVLGAGGMGVVFDAEDTHLKRRVALKVLRPSLATSASARRRFVREGQSAAALNHDLIVPIYQVGEDRGIPFLAMPLLQGETLEDRLRRDTPLPAAEVLAIGRDIAEGLAAAHAQGLIHRDIKPSNIWLETGPGDRCRVKLLDFGLARAVGGDAHLTQSGIVVGTPAYMAPEQARGEPVDQRSDLFSLGCVLYRAATGQFPFPGRNALDTLLALAQHNPPAPAKLNPRLPPGLSDLIVKLLARQPEKRYPTARAAAEALDAVAAGRVPTGPRRRGRSRAILATALLFLVALAAFWLRPEGPPRSESVPDPAPTELFAPAVHLDAGLYPNAVAVADFNRDGKSDLVVSNLQSHSVGVLLGNGDATFRPPVTSPAGGNFAQPLAVADLNGDGKFDVVVVDSTNPVSVLLGKGDGTFLPPESHSVGTQPTSVAVADLDGDGKLDLIVSTRDGISVLLGHGDGTFRAAVVSPAGKVANKLVVADFDRDGKPDVAVTQRDGAVCVLIGKGDGGFRPAVFHPGEMGGLDLAAADLDGDGQLDLVGVGNGVTVQLGRGDGTFGPSARFSRSTTYVAVMIADLDADGRADLALVNQEGGRVDVALGNGDGTFRAPLSHPVGREPSAVAVGDFNGDGALDLAVANKSTNNVSVLLGRPAPYQAHLGPPAFFPAGTQPHAVTVADLDRDGRDDLVVADFAGRAVLLLRNTGDGAFQSAGRIEAGQGPTALVVGDFDRDGRPDVAVADAPGNAVLVLRGQQGTLTAAVAHAAEKNPVAVAVGDFDRDGRPDLVAANYDSGTVSVFLGRGDGTFRAAVHFPAGERPRSVVVVDVNGDGKPDLVVTNRFQIGTVSVLRGKGDGTFTAPVAYPVGAFPICVACGDFNSDGQPDLAVANWGGADLNVLLGNGDGTFAPAVNYGAGPGNPFALTAVDVDGDGRLDLVVSGGVSQDWVSLLRGKGDGTFATTPQFYGTGLHPVGLAVGRFRRGGRPDVVTANAHSGNVAVLLNQRAAPYLRAVCIIESIEPDGMTCLLNVRAYQAAAPWRSQDASYTGTVRVQSSDPRAQLPADHTFGPEQDGNLRVILRTPGNQTLTVTDTQGGRLPAGVAVRTLRPADLHYSLEAPENVQAGTPFSVTVHIMNPFNTWTDGYGGTLRFECGDPAARLPANHTFDRTGFHTFTNAFTLPTPGEWKLTVTDTVTSSLSASVAVKVRPRSTPPHSKSDGQPGNNSFAFS